MLRRPALELASYRIEAAQPELTGTLHSSFFAGNSAQRFVASFAAEGPVISRRADDWAVSFKLESLRCGTTLMQLERAYPRKASSHRVEYPASVGPGHVVEWYDNGPSGLEQGFDLDRSPCAVGSGDLLLELSVDGLVPRPGQGWLELVDQEQRPRLRYGNLQVVDSAGRALESALSVNGAQIVLRVKTAQALFPIQIDPLIWAHQQHLIADDGEGGDDFGNSVALSSDTAIVGSRDDSEGAANGRGSIYAYTFTNGSWAPPQKLLAGDGAASDTFGISVALSGDAAIAGAYLNAGIKGAAYVFRRKGASWAQEQKLVATNSIYMGSSVAIFGDTALVSSFGEKVGTNDGQGAAYVFVHGTSWTQQKRLVASDGAADDFFGSSLAIYGETAVVGSYWNDNGATTDQGAAYVYVRSGTTWTEQQKLTAPDGGKDDYFGYAMALFEDTLLVGSSLTDVAGKADQGAVYAFVRSGTVWTLQQKLLAPDGAAGDGFGGSISLYGNTALISAGTDDVGANSNQGSAYVFTRSGTTWSHKQTLRAPDGQASDTLAATALSANTALLGAYADDVGFNTNQGSAYFFELGQELGDACDADSECLSGHCADDRCCDQACVGDCQACSVAAGAENDGTCSVYEAGATGQPACGELACNGASADCTSCTADAHCPSNTYCNAAGTCQPRKAQGSGCNLGSDCKVEGCRACVTGHCVDEVCCDDACSGGGCMGCLGADTTLADGECGPVIAGTDPKNVCPEGAGYPETCVSDGMCNGVGSCRTAAVAGTACGATTCSNAAVSGRVCNGVGKCSNDDEVPCDPYECSDDQCAASCQTNDDCTEGAYCVSNKCVPQKKPGTSCDAARDCSSGYCSDSVCCNAACTSQCEACAEPGSEGTCVPVTGQPREGRPACKGSADLCGGECNGAEVSGCDYAPATTSCGKSCSKGEALASTCDGRGSCVDGEPRSCGAYACGQSACLRECVTDEDCATGYLCQALACVPASATCSKDGTTSLSSDGSPTPCGAYLCNPEDGRCRIVCTSSIDCVASSVCNEASKTCDAATSPGSNDSSGCGCRSAHSNSPAGLLSFLALAAVLTARRRRYGQ